MTFVFGGENNPKPTPYIIIDTIKNSRGVSLPKNENKINEIVPKAIPIAARICGTYLSDNLPAIGARTTWHNGATSKIIPADCELKPLIYCK
jgi:hypothetical protein